MALGASCRSFPLVLWRRLVDGLLQFGGALGLGGFLLGRALLGRALLSLPSRTLPSTNTSLTNTFLPFSREKGEIVVLLTSRSTSN